jgi:hypothetical protein
MRGRVSCLLSVLVLAGCDSTAVPLPVDSVEVFPSSTSVRVGQTVQLSSISRDVEGSLLKGRAVTWSSGNQTIATVSSRGVVSGVAPGTALITVASESARATATVFVLGVIPATPSAPAVGSTTPSTLAVSWSEVGGTTYYQVLRSMSSSTEFSQVGANQPSTSYIDTGLSAGTMYYYKIVACNSAGCSGYSGWGSGTTGKLLGVGFGAEQFVLVPAGTFQMGSPIGKSVEQPVHTVNITKAFFLQKTEVTQGQWEAVMRSNPSYYADCGDRCPVEHVTWDDIQKFLAELNQLDPGMGYRLPTEAEWEYAARAGTTGDYGGSGVIDDMGWYSGNTGKTTHPVAQKLPNAWGIFDMHGNLWERVPDWLGSYPSGTVTDPTGPSIGPFLVIRGGSYFDSASDATSYHRGIFGAPSSSRFANIGLRLARTR